MLLKKGLLVHANSPFSMHTKTGKLIAGFRSTLFCIVFVRIIT